MATTVFVCCEDMPVHTTLTLSFTPAHSQGLYSSLLTPHSSLLTPHPSLLHTLGAPMPGLIVCIPPPPPPKCLQPLCPPAWPPLSGVAWRIAWRPATAFSLHQQQRDPLQQRR